MKEVPERGVPTALEVGLRLIGCRAHSTAELRQKLRRKGCGAEDVEATLPRLVELGYLDDAAFARSLVTRRSDRRGRSLIASELAAKGIDRALAGEVLAELEAEDQLAAGRRLADRVPTLDAQHLAGRLQRRGFDSGVVRQVLAERRTMFAGGSDRD